LEHNATVETQQPHSKKGIFLMFENRIVSVNRLLTERLTRY